jgi:hypothetical protein
MLKSNSDELKYEIYERNLPEDINTLLINRYNSCDCTIEFFNIFLNYDILNAIFYLDGSGHIIVYTIINNKINVLNGRCTIEEKYINNFCNVVFRKYAQVNKIEFAELYLNNNPDNLNLSHPKLKLRSFNDMIIELPSNTDEYIKKLSKNNRKNLNSRMKKVKKDFSDFEFLIIQKESIEKYHIDRLIELKNKRQEYKEMENALDGQMWKKISDYSKVYGELFAIKIDGEINACQLVYKIGTDYLFCVLCHNPAYNKYGIGQLCYYQAIFHCIENGGKKIYLMQGKSEFKLTSLGIVNNIFDFCVYRSNIYKLPDKLNMYKLFAIQFIKNKTLKLKELSNVQGPKKLLEIKKHIYALFSKQTFN